jgi:hypothetical protein
MTAVIWDAPGEKIYEAGLDRGIMYTADDAVPWNGLTSVERNPFIASKDPLYLDGIKYGDNTIYRPLDGTITALTYPDELLEYQGLLHTFNGMYFNEQPTTASFGLTYRTLIGNDLDGIGHGYKLHLVYNVSVVPDSFSFESLSDSPEPSDFSWAYSTVPIKVAGYAPLSHLEIDSRKAPDGFMEYIEGILYGTPGVAARQPTLLEMLSLMYDGPPDVPGPSSHYPSTTQYPSSTFYPGGESGSSSNYPSGSNYPGSGNYPGGETSPPSGAYTLAYLTAY